MRHLDAVAAKARYESRRSIFLATAARQQLRLVQQGDPTARALWERLRALVRRDYDAVCQLVGLRLDGWTAASDAAASIPSLLGALPHPRPVPSKRGLCNVSMLHDSSPARPSEYAVRVWPL